ncbi:MAG TPA: hypothetical protein VKR54_03165 [Candidatus Babeliales bacterium]|nr:hypothetical protein [Candidatus Babeliales bacterium]
MNDIDREDGVHFVANYGIRKATRVLNRNGVTLKSTGDACKAAIKKVDILPTEGILRDGVNATADYVVKPVVSTVAEQVTKPETLTLIALPYVMQFVAGMLGQK